ncbi:MAG: tetratricopeptide repeat protein [Candidatus Omnitrophica bacterium]|nr:tetratricopeptide repeat protein [Candidatus Omnitrophota bacterium]
MQKIPLKNLLLSFCALLLISCSVPPTYSRKDIAEIIKKICREEHKIEVSTWLVGETLWVYAPVEFFDEAGKFKVNEEGKVDEDLSETVRKISQSIQRALLNMDAPPIFYCFVKSDIQRLKGINLIRMNQYELIFIPDQIRLTLATYGLATNISAYEFEKRIISFQTPFIDKNILEDDRGRYLRKYNVGLAEFIPMLIQERISRTFLAPSLNDNFEVNDIDVRYQSSRIIVDFNVRIKKYSPDIPTPDKEVERITREIVENYSSFIQIKRATINDNFNKKTKTVLFKSSTGEVNKVFLYPPEADSNKTLFKLYKANFYLSQAYRYSQGENKNFDKVIAFCRKTLEISPGYIYAQVLLGETYMNLGRHKQALAAFNYALKLDPRNPTIHFPLGECYRILDRPKEALEEFKQVFLAQPDYPGIIEALSKIYADLGIPEEALQYLERAIENAEAKNSKDPEIYRSIGSVYLRLGQYQKALQYLLRSQKLKDDYFLTYLSLGDVYRLLGDSQKAIDNFEKALRLDPTSISAELGLANTYLTLGQYERAITKYEKVLASIPESPDIYVSLSKAHNELGLKNKNASEQQKALNYLEKALRLDPDNFQIHYSLGETYTNLVQYKKAIQHFRKALIIKPDSPQVYFGMGRTYSALGENQKAKENFLKAHDLFYEYGDYLNARKAEENIRRIP